MRQRQLSMGTSLVELMVASTLGVVLMTAAVQTLTSSSALHNTNYSVGVVKETGQFTLAYLRKLVESAGYFGCLKPSFKQSELAGLSGSVADLDWSGRGVVNPVAKSIASDNLTVTAIRGFEVSSSGALIPDPASAEMGQDNDIASLTLMPEPKKGSDVIALQFAEDHDEMIAPLSVTMGQATDPVSVLASDFASMNLNVGDAVFVGDCSAGDVFNLTSVSAVATHQHLLHEISGNSDASLVNIYSQSMNTFVRQFYSIILYVADTGADASNGDDIFGLYQKNLLNNDPAELIIEDIEFLQVNYGVYSGTDHHLKFVNAAALSDVDRLKIAAVKLGVLVKGKTNNQIPSIDKAYQLLDSVIKGPGNGGALQHSGGTALRKIFTTTVQLRNRA